MNTNIKTAAKLAAFAGAFALTGCAYIPRNVHPVYHPASAVHKIPGANNVTLRIIVKNDKKHHDKDLVSYTIAPAGFETAGVYMHVARDFKAALTSALEERGFHVGGSGNKTVDVTIKHFWFKAHTGWWIHQNGYVQASVFIIKNGITIFHKDIKSNKKGEEASGLLKFDNEHRQKEAESLLISEIDNIMEQKGFISALTK